ncbi:MAG: sulfatase-like hydrolase/transferase [Chlamydiae bacterium]|nr:sulfatase-like hydrolase/transferase [Chlamydiota bacterium]
MKKISINYVYFGFYLLFTILIGFGNVFFLSKNDSYSNRFFCLYQVAQPLLETLVFIMIADFLNKRKAKFIFWSFISATFLIFLFRLFDFILLKFMDFTIWQGLGIATDIGTFIEVLNATHVPLIIWFLFIGSLVISIPTLGLFFYKIANRVPSRKKLYVSKAYLWIFTLFIPLSLAIFDLKAFNNITCEKYFSCKHSLFWKNTFAYHKPKTISARLTLKNPVSEKELTLQLQNFNEKPLHKPNIFLFIIESLREDFMTGDVAPNLYQFKTENIHFDLSLANANGTHLSWFAIFHSNFPYYWKILKDQKWKMGSLPLNILKKSGYKIHLFTTPELEYYHMDELLFGKEKFLIDSYHPFFHVPPIEPYDADASAVRAVKELSNEKEGHVFITFLDATHFLYSWPKNRGAKFNPTIELTPITKSANIEVIKNSYKNAVYYIDELFGEFFKGLKEKNLYDDAVIVIASDHGEEFLEEGFLFHGSHLSSMQTQIPIYYKFGLNERKVLDKSFTCHMDIFHSILDYVFGKEVFAEVLQGSSMFAKRKWPFVVSTRYNAHKTPTEFCIHNGKDKLILNFENEDNIFKPQMLKVKSLKNKNDEDINPVFESEPIDSFSEALKHLFIWPKPLNKQ